MTFEAHDVFRLIFNTFDQGAERKSLMLLDREWDFLETVVPRNFCLA